MTDHPYSDQILEHNKLFIPGGISSMNRITEPNIAFVEAKGSRIQDAEGNEYIDFHGAFAPQFLGYGDVRLTSAVKRVIDQGTDLWGSGPTELEGQLAELLCTHIPWVERVCLLNSGSEATAQAIRLARAVTGRDHLIVMQGGYNGWHNDVAFNLVTPLDKLGPRQSPGEYTLDPMSAGIPEAHQQLVHAINFNDLDSVRYVCEKYSVAALITEPILQNIGLVKPLPGYLEGLRKLADELGFLLIFDEIKTGFRHAFGGYAEISSVTPDLACYGKAIASGYPLGALAGPAKWMDSFAHADPAQRVLLTEPILQNIGLVKPLPGYLEGLRKLADELGFLLIFDEIKTGFRHAFGGYAEISSVTPDLACYGKAIASGYPLGALAGPAKWMDSFAHADPAQRVLLAGTYNAHPVPTAAAIATMMVLLENDGAVYARLEELGGQMETGINEILEERRIQGQVVRQGSAFVTFFMDHKPRDWHDLASSHDYEFDTKFRRALLEQGVFFFPLATKQCSISAAHSQKDIDQTLDAIDRALDSV